jgi:hypothetical protein
MTRVCSQSDWSKATAVTSLVPRHHFNYLYWRLSQNPNLNFEFAICFIPWTREPPVHRQNQYSDLIRPGWRWLTSLLRPQPGKYLDLIPDKQPTNPVYSSPAAPRTPILEPSVWRLGSPDNSTRCPGWNAVMFSLPGLVANDRPQSNVRTQYVLEYA